MCVVLIGVDLVSLCIIHWYYGSWGIFIWSLYIIWNVYLSGEDVPAIAAETVMCVRPVSVGYIVTIAGPYIGSYLVLLLEQKKVDMLEK